MESYLFIYFIFSPATLSQTSENRHPRNFPTRRGLVFNRTFAIAISSKCPIKHTGAEKLKICTIFHAKSQTLPPEFNNAKTHRKSKTLALSIDHSTILMPDLVGGPVKTTEIQARFWADPLAHPAILRHMHRIFGTSEDRNFKFCVRIDPGKSHLTDDKMSPKMGVVRVQGQIFF